MNRGRYEPEYEGPRTNGVPRSATCISIAHTAVQGRSLPVCFGQPGMRTALYLRMSCIYGLHQFGNEDQRYFLILKACKASRCHDGDGCQVRDVLFVEDLVDAFLLVQGRRLIRYRE